MLKLSGNSDGSSNKVDPLASPPPSAATTTTPSRNLKSSLKSGESFSSAASGSNKKQDDANNVTSDKKNSTKKRRRRREGKLSIAFVWMTSLAMAMSLFQIMTYEPNVHPHAAAQHAADSNANNVKPHPMAHMIDHSEWKIAHAKNTENDPKRRSYNFEKSKQQRQGKVDTADARAVPKQHVQQAHGNNNNNNKQSTTAAKKTTSSHNTTTNSDIVILKDAIAQDATLQDNPLVQVLQQAGITEIARDDFEQLPQVTKNLQHLYHRTTSSTLTDPSIIGLDTCEHYRNVVAPNVSERYSSAAGMFNTGTNALTFALEHNVQAKMHQPWQVPWGKHRMEYRRLNHTASGMEHFNQTQCLPIVIIRDPFHWMQSMCKSPYAAKWRHLPKLRCPNLVPTPQDRHRWANLSWDGGTKEENDALQSFPVKVLFDKIDLAYFDSLVGLWSDWYRPYLEATYPRIMIRFEDMLLQAPLIVKRISECMGLPPVPVKDFKIQTNSAKGHGSHTTFLKAIIKSGNAEARTAGLTPEDLEYAAQHLDKQLMNTFHYHVPGDD